jgi:glycosyltransferase involved in cell wall biosynthesis
VSATRVLFILHNHPSVQAGGTESYTLNVYESLRRSPDFEPMIVARVDRPEGAPAGTRFTPLPGDPNQYLVQIETEGYDFTLQTFRNKSLYVRDFADFLTTHKPDVVHFQHHLYVGADLISTVRRMLPSVPIVYTLHEFLPICNHYGQLIRTHGRGLCLEASPRRCNECFPTISAQTFFMRKRFIQSHFSEVDLFIAPSRFLLERYVDWGIPENRIRHEEHGFPPVIQADEGPPRPRNRFAFFGVMTPFKGINVLLRAMVLLGPGFDGRLSIHGTGKLQMPDESAEVQNEIDELIAQAAGGVTFCGPYDHERDMPRLMAETDWVVMPSIWWENSPLVIAEAFQYGRPVICSDIGGMAERVTHEVNGLHSRVGDPGTLAGTISRAATTPGLWEKLHAGIPAVRTIDDHVAALTDIYREMLERRASAGDGASPATVAG